VLRARVPPRRTRELARYPDIPRRLRGQLGDVLSGDRRDGRGRSSDLPVPHRGGRGRGIHPFLRSPSGSLHDGVAYSLAEIESAARIGSLPRTKERERVPVSAGLAPPTTRTVAPRGMAKLRPRGTAPAGLGRHLPGSRPPAKGSIPGGSLSVPGQAMVL